MAEIDGAGRRRQRGRHRWHALQRRGGVGSGELGGAIGGSGDDGGTRAKNVQLRSMKEKNGRCEQMQNYGMVDMRLSGCRIGSGCIEIGGERREKRQS